MDLMGLMDPMDHLDLMVLTHLLDLWHLEFLPL
jgi:hypothetical protein